MATNKPAVRRAMRRYQPAWKQLRTQHIIHLEVRTGFEARVIKAICKEKDMDPLRVLGSYIRAEQAPHKTKQGITTVTLTLKQRTLIQDL